MSSWKEILQQNSQRYLDETLELLRIASVSADDGAVAEVRRCAEWVATRLRAAKLEHVEIFPTGKHACVYADWLYAPGKPTVLIYGHFDVQPPDPLDLWDSPPFEPVIKDGRIYARGAADMKANLLLSVAAVEARLQAEGALPVNVKFVLEGQEEIGSRDLGPFVAANKELLACDLVLTPDGAQWAEDRPAIWMGTKGLCAVQIDLDTAAMDMHSGIYGGAVPNANHALIQLLGTLRSADGRIAVDGFYDTVLPLSAEDRAAMAEVPFDAAGYQAEIGIDALVGEPGYSTYERAWARPTLEINGIWGGYQGDGVKTVIPAKSHAKITCRLVKSQEPEDILDKIEAHLKRHSPPGARLSTSRYAGSARPYLLPREAPGVEVVGSVLEEIYGKPPYYVRTGGSLPITDMFLQELGAYTISLGFALEDERMHSPNEFIRLASIERGRLVYGEVLGRLAAKEG